MTGLAGVRKRCSSSFWLNLSKGLGSDLPPCRASGLSSQIGPPCSYIVDVGLRSELWIPWRFFPTGFWRGRVQWVELMRGAQIEKAGWVFESGRQSGKLYTFLFVILSGKKSEKTQTQIRRHIFVCKCV